MLALRFDGWGTLPLQALRGQISRILPEAPSAQPPATLADQLLAADRHHPVRLLLVLDEFERHLREPTDRPGIVRFDLELAACITDPAVPLHVLLVVDDAKNPSLQRYRQWLPELDRDWLRLPSAPAEAAALWSDTDIQPLADETGRSLRQLHDDELDLVLDDAVSAQPTASGDNPASAAPTDNAAGPAPITPDPSTVVPDPVARWSPPAAAPPPWPPAPASSRPSP